MASRRPFTVAIASSGLGHVARGIEAWASDLAAALNERGINVRLYKGAGTAKTDYERVVPCWPRASEKTQALLAKLPRRLSWRLGLGSGYNIEQTTFAWNLIKTLRTEPADILHVQDPHIALLLHRARRLGLVHTRTILAHGTEESLDFIDQFEFLQHLAPWHLEQARSAGVWRRHWTAIPNFIDTDHFSPAKEGQLRAELGIPTKAIVVVSVAAIKRSHKRIDHLLRSFSHPAILQNATPIYLVIAGGHESETNDLIAEGKQRLGDRVRFLVRFPRDRMPELYHLASLFVLASQFEMMPIALLESIASAVPCIVHHHPVMQWMIGPGGASIDMSHESQLTETILKWIHEPETLNRLGQQARQHCLALFSQDTVVSQILSYYEKVSPQIGCIIPCQ